MNEELLNEFIKLNKLLILLLTKDLSQNNKILFLSNSGFSPKDIGELLNTTRNTVSVTLNQLKKRSKK
jgi:DNA-binding CsgD family transcriptional regulator